MKNECKIIQDILPLYIENIINDETKAFVEEHLAGCDDCRSLLKNMKKPQEIPPTTSAAPLRYLKKNLLKKRILTVIFTALIVLTIVITGLAYLTSPKFLPYSEDILSLTETENGMIICTFSSEVSGYEVYNYINEDGKTEYHISAWKTLWGEHFSKRDKQNYIIEESGNQILVYYDMNNENHDDILIYGETTNNHVRSLPRLALGYYLIIAMMACIAFAIMLFVFRKKSKAKLWLERVLLLPITYIIAHICIKGFKTTTYSMQRDFSLILLITILIYLACILGINLYRSKKQSQNI